MSDTDDAPYEDGPAPPKPRKQPQQSRSRMLVDSVKQACLQILKNEGPRALTATRIAEISGVAMGSVYQYFPNVDSIIATIYEDLIVEEIEVARNKVATEWQQMTLEQAFTSMIRGTLAFHRRMLKLDEEFHRRFYQTFDLNRWFNRLAGDPEAASRAMRDVVLAHQDEIPTQNPAMEAFILTAATRSAILESVKYHPEYLEAPEFAEYLLKLCYGVLGQQLDRAE